MRKVVGMAGAIIAVAGVSSLAEAGVAPCSGYPCTTSVSGGSVTYTSPNSYTWAMSGYSGSGTWSTTTDSSGGTTVSWSQAITGITTTFSGTCYISAAGATTGNCGPLAGSLNTTTPTTPTTTPTSDAPTAPTTPTSAPLVVEQFGVVAANRVQAAALAATNEAVVSGEVRATGRIISNRIRSIVKEVVRGRRQQVAAGGGMGQGMAGGSQPTAFGGWVDGSFGYQSIDDGASSETRNWSGLAGFDYAAKDWLILGLTAGYINSNVDIDSLGISRNSDAAVIGPYIAFILSPTFTLDGSLQYTRSRVSVDVDGNNPYRGDFDADRISAAVNLTGFWSFNPVDISAFAGWSYGHESASNSALKQLTGISSADVRDLLGAKTETFHALRVGGEASWRQGNWEPFGGVELEYQLTDVSSGDAFNPSFGLGLRYHVTETFQLNGNVSGDPFGDERSMVAQVGGRVNF